MDIKQLIIQQKKEARKDISDLQIKSSLGEEEHLRIIYAKGFLKQNFKNINGSELLKTIHKFRHLDCVSLSLNKCPLCNKIAMDILPRFGNLMQILEEEAQEETAIVERRRMPSQNDLTRWALKDAVLSFYQGLNFPDDLPVVTNRFDDRLVTELAPDFDVIARVWLEKLDELKRRDDKYTLILEEYDKAEADLQDGMRGSAFEKQLDRFREEFMQKLVR